MGNTEEVLGWIKSTKDYMLSIGERWYADCLEEAIDLLEWQEWHAITEDDDGVVHGLPGDDGQYLMTDGKDIWIDDYMNGVSDGVFLDSGRDIREIKAWMYMPELPKRDRRVNWIG